MSNQFKAGDRVRITDKSDYDSPLLGPGSRGRVDRVGPTCIHVVMDEDPYPHLPETDWTFYPEQLERVS